MKTQNFAVTLEGDLVTESDCEHGPKQGTPCVHCEITNLREELDHAIKEIGDLKEELREKFNILKARALAEKHDCRPDDFRIIGALFNDLGSVQELNRLKLELKEISDIEDTETPPNTLQMLDKISNIVQDSIL